MSLQPFGVFLAEEERVEACLIEPGILPFGGKVLLYGAAGIGKSMLVSQLAFDVANGLPWMGVWQTQAGVVVYVQCELPRGQFRKRIRRQYEAYRDTPAESVYLLTTLTMRAQRGDVEFASLLDSLETIRPSLVILDPQYKLLADGADENSARDIMACYNALDTIIARVGCAVLLVAHSRKTKFDEAGNPMDGGYQDLRGSGRQNEWADAVLHLKSKSNNKASLEVEKIRYDVAPETLQLSKMDDATLIRLAEGGRGKADDDLLMLLDVPRMRADVMVQLQAQGYSESTVKRALTKLSDERLVVIYDSPDNKTMKLVRKI